MRKPTHGANRFWVVGSAGGHVRRDVLVPGAVLENMLS